MSKGSKAYKLTDYERKRIEFALRQPDYVISDYKKPRGPKPPKPAGLLPPGLYQRGYGKVEYWPFSIKKAVSESGYRRGVLAAMRNPAYNTAWRAEAKYYMEITYDIIFGKREPMEVLHFSK